MHSTMNHIQVYAKFTLISVVPKLLSANLKIMVRIELPKARVDNIKMLIGEKIRNLGDI